MSRRNLQTASQFITYTSVGAVGTGLHYAVLIISVTFLGVDPVIGTVCGAIIGAVNNYIMNYVWTFRSSKSHFQASAKFFLIAGLATVLSGGLMYIGTKILGLHYFLTQLVATGLILCLTFVANKVWTY